MHRYLLCLVLVGCGKPTTAATASPTDAAASLDNDALDRAMVLLLDSLTAGDYDALNNASVEPLTHDLSRTEFDDLAAIVQWLGPVSRRDAKATDMSHGGGQRRYELHFETASPVSLEVRLDADDKLIGFQFGGDGYTEAERGVLAEPWREFKVYDFVYLDAEGTPLAKDAKIAGTRVDYELVVGGIEAFIGEHHLTIEKIVFDANGREVFHEPIEFDVKFDADATGIPRGVVHGHLEVPGPGAWEMSLQITDRNANRDVEHRQRFVTVP